MHKKDPLKDKFIDDLLRTPEFKHMKREDLLTKSKIYLYSISKSEEEIRIDTELMKTLEKEMIELLPEFETMSKIPAYSEQIGPIIRDIIRMEEKLKTPTSVNLTISRNKLEQLKTDILETINKCKSIIDKEITLEAEITKKQHESRTTNNQTKITAMKAELEQHRLTGRQQLQQLDQHRLTGRQQLQQLQQLQLVPSSQQVVPQQVVPHYVQPRGGGKKSPKKTTKKKSTTTRKKKTSTAKKSPKIHIGKRGGRYIIRKGRKIYQ